MITPVSAPDFGSSPAKAVLMFSTAVSARNGINGYFIGSSSPIAKVNQAGFLNITRMDVFQIPLSTVDSATPMVVAIARSADPLTRGLLTNVTQRLILRDEERLRFRGAGYYASGRLGTMSFAVNE